MADKIIDLKKMVQKTPPVSEAENVRESDNVFLKWSSYEREKLSHRPLWFLWPGSVAILLIVISLFAKSYFFIAFVVLAFVVLVMYATRDPEKFEFMVTPEGIFINHKFHAFSELKSFFVFDKPALRELSLETNQLLHPFIHIPLGETKAEEVKEVLRHFLTEKEHPIFLIDQLMKKWGL